MQIKMKLKRFISNPLLKLIKLKFVLVGVPVIIQNNDGKILLEKRANYLPTYPGYWGLPGGLMNKGEHSQQTAEREIKEELGVKIRIIKKSKNIYEPLPTKECPTQYINIVYHAKISQGIPKPKNETSEISWFKPSEIKKIKLAYNHRNILKKEGIIK